jgi:putative transposase
MVIPPKYAVSKVIETLKSVSSGRLKTKFPHFLSKVYWDDGGIWARGFFVSTVGINEATIRRYVRYQGKQDAGQAELELLGYFACKGGVLHFMNSLVSDLLAKLNQTLH